MKKFTVLPHSADIRLLLEASTITELFEVSLIALGYILGTKTRTDEKKLIKKIDIASDNVTNLLIDFLSNVLTFSYLDKAIYERMQIAKLKNNSLSATLFGVPVASFKTDIKAVTYHEADIVKNKKGNYQTIVILDI